MNFQGGNRLVMEKLKQQNDRYHKKRLIEIQNSKLKQQKIIPKIEDRKGNLIEQCKNMLNLEKKQQIQKQNTALFLKMNKIFDKKPQLSTLYFAKIKHVNTSKLNQNQAIKQRIDAQKSFYSQEKFDYSWKQAQKYKKSITKFKPKSISSYEANSMKDTKELFFNEQKLNKTIYKKDDSQIDHNQKQKTRTISNSTVYETKLKAAKESFEANMKIFENLHQQNNSNQRKEKEDKFTKPEQILERIILYKKSHIIDNQKSYLIEISIAYKKLFILVFDMQSPKNIFRLIFNQNRYLEILNDNEYNFSLIASKISIQSNGISLKKNNAYKNNQSDKQSQFNSTNNKFNKKSINTEKQELFLKRNYYNMREKKQLPPPFPNNISQPQTFIQKQIVAQNNRFSGSVQQKPTTSGVKKRFKFQNGNNHKQRKEYDQNSKNCIKQQDTESQLFLKDKQNQQDQLNKLQIDSIMKQNTTNKKNDEYNQLKLQSENKQTINQANEMQSSYNNENFEQAQQSPKK